MGKGKFSSKSKLEYSPSEQVDSFQQNPITSTSSSSSFFKKVRAKSSNLFCLFNDSSLYILYFFKRLSVIQLWTIKPQNLLNQNRPRINSKSHSIATLKNRLLARLARFLCPVTFRAQLAIPAITASQTLVSIQWKMQRRVQMVIISSPTRDLLTYRLN